MLVLINGKQEQKTYEEICHALGFIPDIKFVEVTPKGEITFTCGKPHEIRSLINACEEKGFRPAKSMLESIA